MGAGGYGLKHKPTISNDLKNNIWIGIHETIETASLEQLLSVKPDSGGVKGFQCVGSGTCLSLNFEDTSVKKYFTIAIEYDDEDKKAIFQPLMYAMPHIPKDFRYVVGIDYRTDKPTCLQLAVFF
eukprot:GHVP01036469.1.p1 GENE.GHVP01036469.1~~GHVP01036469.1.p1  ORF type:complete len:125 (-),score=16.22 GHVP01036469.1:188-562(-)